jgi:hypothetical protein
MKSDSKPGTVTLKGQSTATPAKSAIKLDDELGEAELDQVAGGAIYMSYPSYTQVEKVNMPAGFSPFHLAAWGV